MRGCRIWGVSAILSKSLPVALSRSGRRRWFYFASLLALILFVATYARVSKPALIGFKPKRQKPEKDSRTARELQAAVGYTSNGPCSCRSSCPCSGQCPVLLVASAQMWLVRSPLKSQELFRRWIPINRLVGSDRCCFWWTGTWQVIHMPG